METSVDLTEVIVRIAVGIVAIAVAYLVPKAKEALGVTIERKHELALQAALQKGARFAIEQLGEDGAFTVDMRHKAAKRAAEYAMDHVPDAVEYLQKSLPALRDMAVSRVAEELPNVRMTEPAFGAAPVDYVKGE